MRKAILLIGISIIFSCKHDSKTPVSEETEITISETKDTLVDANFDWMLGDWVRTNDDDGQLTYEQWHKINDQEYQGFSYTMRDQDTTWQEHVTLKNTNGQWSFDVIGKGEATPTTFEVTHIKENLFTCKNPENEFPTRIDYFKTSDTLKAVISGNDMVVPFDFVLR